MKFIARLILIIALVIWLGPAFIGFVLLMILFYALLTLAGWNKPPPP
ncbi:MULTISPECIES: hypothetical protein [Acinetobacter]|nr:MULTISPECIES: hypothetical protein [unclassified Acinetobacter]MDA0695842.1 hypothetical protein [Pseudomonadota bacterium]|tara:strand:- start:175 stop:315 length:141 start_codon:yes stop_codon:yes gene_type:complete